MAHHEAAGMHTRMDADMTSAPSIRRQTLYLYHIWPIFRQIRLYAFFANWTIAIHLSPKYL